MFPRVLSRAALAASLSLAALTAQAEIRNEANWQAGPFTVSRNSNTDHPGLSWCGFGWRFFADDSRYSISRLPDGDYVMMVAFGGTPRWTGEHVVSIGIDGVIYTVPGAVPGGDPRFLRFFLNNVDFRHAFYNGQTMTISVDGVLRTTYPLNGSATALTVMNSLCAPTIGVTDWASTHDMAPPVATASPPTQPVYATQPPPSFGARVEAALVRDSGVRSTRVMLNNAVPANLIVDSGAADMTIPRSVAIQLFVSGTLTEADYVRTNEYTQADGTTHFKKAYRLRSVTIGGATISNVTCTIGESEDVALLGQSFLSRFSSWSIDNARNVLVLTP